MDVFDYISSSNPRETKKLISSFGYNSLNQDNSQNLRELVQKEGETAVHEIFKIHPDFEYFQDLFTTNKLIEKKEKKQTIKVPHTQTIIEKESNQNKMNDSTNIIILASAMILAIAIITK